MQCNDEAIIAYCEHVHSEAAYEKDSAKTPFSPLSSSLSAIVANVRCSKKNYRENLFLGSENGKQVLLAGLSSSQNEDIYLFSQKIERAKHARIQPFKCDYVLRKMIFYYSRRGAI